MFALLYAIIMATIDIVSLGTVKYVYIGKMPMVAMIGAVFIYALQPVLFLQSLSFQGMALMNLLWNVISSILVTLVGVWYFKESLTHTKAIGAIFSVLAIVLLSCEDT